MSVDLPAPFSPSRACTSPRRRSKSTLSFAVERAEALGDALQLEGERVALLGQGYLVGLIGMSVISPDSIFASASSTWSVYLAPSALVLP